MKTPGISIVKNVTLAGLLVISQFGLAQSAIPVYIQSAVASSARNAEMVARDEARKPAELLTLSGIEPGDTIVEFAGFGQYYTTMLAEIVGAGGKVHMFDLPYTEERSGADSRAFIAAHPNTTYTLVDYNAIELPNAVDIVYNVLYYHDLSLNNIDTAVLNKKIFDALKPGGVFLVNDHNAAPGSGTRDTESLHRIDPQVIKAEILAAGFVLADASDLLTHADDDHTAMVFAPGTRGSTDQSLFKFVKPE